MTKSFGKSPANADVMCFVESKEPDRLDPDRYSCWKKLTQLHAHVTRFISNCRLPPDLRRKGPVTVDEITDAETFLIKQAQHTAFREEIVTLQGNNQLPHKSKLLLLRPIIDQEGLLRCDSRLKYSSCLPWETKYPIILPRHSHITKLIIKRYHDKSGHAGTNYVLAQLSAKYWILAAREAIRAWENECAECKRRRTKPVHPSMAPLPELRARKSLRAFSETSVDIGGPYITKQGRGKTRQKRYLCLFTCLGTRAIHLEIVFNLSTDSFMNAFYRMAARRGMPSEMVSDNGTNFLGAKNELDELAAMDTQRIKTETAYHKVKWRFNPPAAPHFNGVHESIIKAAKRAINVILGAADINDEELLSAINGAEGLLNSRPLTYQSADAGDIIPLTPNHFLHGQVGGQFAPEVIDEVAFNPRKRWRRVQELVPHAMQRWMKELLPSLSPRTKWFKDEIDFKVGDVVIVPTQDMPRGKWPLGRITAVHPGSDGIVRVVDVKVQGTTLRRPVVKLCPLASVDDLP